MSWEAVNSLIGSIQTHSLVSRPTTSDECRETIAYAREHGLKICPRGAGRSYGDEALCHKQVLLDVSGMNRILDFDEENSQITVEAGMRLIDIFQHVHGRLLTLASSPTESHSTVSGALSANVNGKDGWKQGNFYHQVVRLRLLTAAGEELEVDSSHSLFNAVVSGIGLVGVVLDVTLQLQPIPSPYLAVRALPAPDVDALLAAMAEVEASNDVAVAWVDAYARGSKTGRSVVHAGSWTEHAANQQERDVILSAAFEGLDRHRRFGLALHEVIGPLLSLMLYAQRPMLKLFNAMYYGMNVLTSRWKRGTKSELFVQFSFAASFTVPPAHLVCGPRGYTIQLSFPRSGARDAIVEFMGILQSSPCPPVTTILRAHSADDGILSFYEDGYSLNCEFHPKKHNEAACRAATDRLIEATARRGGKVYLAKDQILTSTQFSKMYPRYPELLAIKQSIDPEGLFTSDLARRVGLVK